MPCCDPRPASEITTEARKIVDELTQDLCYLCGELQGAGTLNKIASSRILIWWKRHHTADAKRVHKVIRGLFGEKTVTEAWQYLIDEAIKVHPLSMYHRGWFLCMVEDVYVEEENKLRKLRQNTEARKKVTDKLTDAELKDLGLER